MDKVWAEQFVEENNLAVQISALRKIFGETKSEHHFIVTVPGKGYSFVAELNDAESEIIVESHSRSRIVVEEETIENGFSDSGDNAATVDTRLPSAPPSSNAASFASEIKQHKRGFLVALSVLILTASGLSYWYFFQHSSGAMPIESIAVLPFVNESGNSDVEYLSDGMTESLINRLSQIPRLSVKARSTVFRYKGTDILPHQISTDLNVQAIVHGRVVQRGNDLILYLSLIDVQTGNQIWGEQYNRKLTDFVSLQSEIARDVSNKLKTKLSDADKQKLAKNYTENTEAYQSYLKGRFFWNKRTPNDFRKAIEYFQQAVALDPNYALAYTGLADAYALLPNYGGAPAREVMQKAREAALKALSLDDQLAEAHAALGAILGQYDYDYAAEEREYKRAIELNPNYATAHQWYGELFSRLGRHEEAFAEFRRALEIDPLSLIINRSYGDSLLYARRYDEAVAQLKRTVELDANFAGAHASLAVVYQVKGNYAESVEEVAKFRELVGATEIAALMQESYARGGWQGFLRAMTGKHRPADVPSFIAATFYAELGEKDEAFAELNKAYENHEIFLTLKVDPRLDALRDDPRFQDLMQRIGL